MPICRQRVALEPDQVHTARLLSGHQQVKDVGGEQAQAHQLVGDRGVQSFCTGDVRLDSLNESELDYYLLPQLDLPSRELHVTARNSAEIECFRFDDLNFLYGMSERERLHRRI